MIELNPGNSFAWHDKGVALRRLERYQEALEVLDKEIELDPGNSSAWQGKAEASYHLNLPTDALEAIDKALSHEKDEA